MYQYMPVYASLISNEDGVKNNVQLASTSVRVLGISWIALL